MATSHATDVPMDLDSLTTEEDDSYSLQASEITQFFPNDLWNQIFHKACFPELPINQLLPLRLVCSSWDQVICSFTEINTTENPTAIPHLLKIFTLKSLDLSVSIPDMSLLTSLKKLKLRSLTLSEQTIASNDMRELSHLTNLTKLTLCSDHISSLGPLTELNHLSLKWPYALTREEVDKAPHLTRLVADSKNIFTHGTGVFKYPLQLGGLVTYDGEWRDCVNCGKGVYWTRGVSRYEGDFADDTFHGFGKMFYFESGNQFEGTWNNGNRVEGVTRFADGNRYEGQYKNAQREGRGTLFFSDGSRYEGEWKAGYRHGQGITYENGREAFIGRWENDLKTGHGIIVYANGRWEGQFAESKRNGYGVFLFQNGDRFEGEYRDDLRKGKGIAYYANGDTFDGDWVCNLDAEAEGVTTSGKGIARYANGDRYEGEWFEPDPRENSGCRRHGHGIMRYANGEVVECDWKNDERV